LDAASVRRNDCGAASTSKARSVLGDTKVALDTFMPDEKSFAVLAAPDAAA
jgi:hypothetical protein